MDFKLQGVGPATEEKLNKLGINTLDDLIKTYPRKYTEYPFPVESIQSITKKQMVAIKGKVCGALNFYQKRTTLNIQFEGVYISAIWFRAPINIEEIKQTEYVFYGQADIYNGRLQLIQPVWYDTEYYYNMCGKPSPIYPLTKGLKQATMKRIIKNGLELYNMEDHIDESVRLKYGMMTLRDAIKNIHNPTDDFSLKRARQRLVYDEFYEFKKAVIKTSSENLNICKMKNSLPGIENSLKFKLTNAQQKALDDIRTDMKSDKCMTRLIQGDVGCGKSIIAFLTLIIAAKNDYQGAMLAPTEVLAIQHYNELSELIKTLNININVVLLTGSTKRKKSVYKTIKDGNCDIVIGTHAIFQEGVEYKNLALAIIDEEHKFGVEQRNRLTEKGAPVHLLLMTATPIPRSKGLVLYGSMKETIINELPANRKAIKNVVLDSSEIRNALGFALKEINKGHQAYVICSMVEENENFDVNDVISYTDKLKQLLPTVSVGMVHGKMSNEEKDDIMEKFKLNQIQLLVSTTVVEVGVNVPNATVMIIEDANQFGLAQLHQLRGRVGRGSEQGYCIFINNSSEPNEKLQIIASTNDGFKIAEEDMRIRGVGDMLGTRQSGSSTFKLLDFVKDEKIIKVVNYEISQEEKRETA